MAEARRSPRFLSIVLASILGTFLAGGILFLVFILFMLTLTVGADQSVSVRSGTVLVVKLSGTVPEVASNSPFKRVFDGETSYSLYDLSRALKYAASDSRIDAVWIQTGAFSNSWASLEAIRRAFFEFKKSGKPIIASGKAFTMSERSYFVASVADSIFADPESLFEFNGFALSVPYYSDLLKRLHVTPQVVKAGTYKSAVEPFLRSSMSPENREQLQAIVDDVATTFYSSIAEARDLDDSMLRELANTVSVGTARDALQYHLLDGMRYDDGVRQSLRWTLGREEQDEIRTVSVDRYIRSQQISNKNRSDEIAVVYAVGAITSGKSSDNGDPLTGTRALGSETFRQTIERAASKRNTRAIVVRINSPGGFAPAADAMLRDIQNAGERFPIVVSMGNLAASGGYWMALAADTVVAESMTLTGSIGAFSLFFDLSGLFEDHLGIYYDGVQAGDHADMFSGMRTYTADERRVLQKMTDDLYESFKQKVSESRKLSVDAVERLAEGRVWTGLRAQELGLVDTVGGLEDAISLAAARVDLADGEYSVRTYPRERSFFEQISSMMENAAVRIGFMSRMDPTVSRAYTRYRLLVERLQADAGPQLRMPIPVRID